MVMTVELAVILIKELILSLQKYADVNFKE
jgi:hypothetical protein